MFEEKVKELAKLRKELVEEREGDYKQKKAEIESSLAYLYYKGCLDDIEKLETEIRQGAEANFKATGEKNPHPAVEIKENVVLTYVEVNALNYAQTNLQVAIIPPSLDKKVFEKQIRALPEEKIPTFIEVTKVGKATIKKDLSEFLNN